MAAKSWTVKQLLKMLEGETISFSDIYQRSYVWDISRESNLIGSLIENYAIPALSCNRNVPQAGSKDKAQYNLLNGKQRLSALDRIVKDQVKMQDVRRLKLDPEYPLTFTDEEKTLLQWIVEEGEQTIDINGLSFGEFPKELQDLILGRMLRVEYYENMTREEERQMIINLNSGKGMSNIERDRIEMASFIEILRIASHPIFKVALSESAIARYFNEDISRKAYVMLHMAEPNFNTKVLRPYMRDAIVTLEQEQEIVDVFDRILAAYDIVKERNAKISKRFVVKIHITNMVPVIKRSLDENVPLERMAKWLEYFFSGKKSASISDVYNHNSGTNTGAAQSIRLRVAELTKSYEEFIVKGSVIPDIEQRVVKPKAGPKKETATKKGIIRTVWTGNEEDTNAGTAVEMDAEREPFKDPA